MPAASWSERVPARSSRIVALVLAALPLGCTGPAEMMLVDPAKYQLHTCVQLEREMKTLSEHAHELRALHDRAVRDSAGAVIARIAYEPDYLSTIGNIRLIAAAAQDRDCDPPIAPAIATPAR
jgi:hypothetical protein